MEANTSFILVVDDQEADGLSMFFEGWGLPVWFFYSGEEALRFLSQTNQTCSLLVTDYLMPQMDGIQFIDTLLNREFNPKHIILCTSMDSIESSFKELQEKWKHPSLHYLAKPFTVKQVIPLLRTFFSSV